MPLRVMTLGDFRRMTKALPDETVMVVESTEYQFTYYETAEQIKSFPASLDAPPAIILNAGQEITEDHHLIPRLDVWLEYGDFLQR